MIKAKADKHHKKIKDALDRAGIQYIEEPNCFKIDAPIDVIATLIGEDVKFRKKDIPKPIRKGEKIEKVEVTPYLSPEPEFVYLKKDKERTKADVDLCMKQADGTEYDFFSNIINKEKIEMEKELDMKYQEEILEK